MPDARTTVDPMQARLTAWAAWLTGGRCADGYPTKSVLHQSWLPPAPGQTPTMRSSPASSERMERELDAQIRTLSQRLQDTLAVVYVMRARPDEQVLRLQCQASTVRARVAEAKRLLGLMQA